MSRPVTGSICEGVDEDAQRRLDRYMDCLLRWAPRINLTGAETRDKVFETLVAPILGAEVLLQPPAIDVGSGNGSPGLILAALRPETPITLLEPRGKRWAFLREAVREMGLSHVTVLRQRSEEYRGAPAQTITLRAVGLDPAKLKAMVRPGGCILVFGGPPRDQTEVIRLASGSRVQRCCFT